MRVAAKYSVLLLFVAIYCRALAKPDPRSVDPQRKININIGAEDNSVHGENGGKTGVDKPKIPGRPGGTDDGGHTVGGPNTGGGGQGGGGGKGAGGGKGCGCGRDGGGHGTGAGRSGGGGQGGAGSGGRGYGGDGGGGYGGYGRGGDGRGGNGWGGSRGSYGGAGGINPPRGFGYYGPDNFDRNVRKY